MQQKQMKLTSKLEKLVSKKKKKWTVFLKNDMQINENKNDEFA